MSSQPTFHPEHPYSDFNSIVDKHTRVKSLTHRIISLSETELRKYRSLDERIDSVNGYIFDAKFNKLSAHFLWRYIYYSLESLTHDRFNRLFDLFKPSILPTKYSDSYITLLHNISINETVKGYRGKLVKIKYILTDKCRSISRSWGDINNDIALITVYDKLNLQYKCDDRVFMIILMALEQVVNLTTLPRK